ncbi:hypothetical protein [Sphingopyxis sp. NFH-91]|uniref:hypothetical protein n=1 Tax=Sphingopyxis sp. NFH-91 TaxID=2744457 RepID=UPI001F30FA6E|nr:hypothetical protein [Sphingopyxis sp. NFH-91]
MIDPNLPLRGTELKHNPYTHFGKPLLGSGLATMAIGGFLLAVGGEEFRKAYAREVFIHCIYAAAIGFLVWLVFEVRTNRFKFPEVARVIHQDLILLCKPEDWLGMGAAVSIYRSDGDYERIVGPAEVINIQQNGLVQIQVLDVFEDEVERQQLTEALRAIDKAHFVIKPGTMKGWSR